MYSYAFLISSGFLYSLGMFSAMYSITSVGSSSIHIASLTCAGVLLFKTAVIALKMSERVSFVTIPSTSLTFRVWSLSLRACSVLIAERTSPCDLTAISFSAAGSTSTPSACAIFRSNAEIEFHRDFFILIT